MSPEETIRAKYESLREAFGERERRLWAGAEALALGHGGIAIVGRATGMSRNTVVAGMRDLAQGPAPAADRQRRPGGGRRREADRQPGLLEALRELVDPATRGDPESALRWTSKSTAKLRVALRERGFEVGENTVARLLKAEGYRLQVVRKTREGTEHPDRDAQFRNIATRVARMQTAGQPVISVDCKKKELVGDFKNAGREWQPAGEPEPVRVHDFLDPSLGKAIPYGVYDVTRNEAWVSVGSDHETAEFAASTIGQWWRRMGRGRYAEAGDLLIVCDGGGSNGSRNRAWKMELQDLADRTGLVLHVSHLPPGTSKWNKIEHRLFAQITQNWRGRPLVSLEVIVNLIASTTTTTGLKVRAKLDPRKYPTGRVVTKGEMETLALVPDDFHGEWNYTIQPRSTLRE